MAACACVCGTHRTTCNRTRLAHVVLESTRVRSIGSNESYGTCSGSRRKGAETGLRSAGSVAEGCRHDKLAGACRCCTRSAARAPQHGSKKLVSTLMCLFQMSGFWTCASRCCAHRLRFPFPVCSTTHRVMRANDCCICIGNERWRRSARCFAGSGRQLIRLVDDLIR